MANNIILTGFSGTGKTTIGQRVATSLGWSFSDIDEIIALHSNKTILRIFEEDGEQSFRALERETINRVLHKTQIVIATGGGAIGDLETISEMKKHGIVVNLEASPTVILERLKAAYAQDTTEASVRPLLNDPNPIKRINTLRNERQFLYSQAHWTIQTDSLSINETMHEVLHAYKLLRPHLLSPTDTLSSNAASVTHGSGSYPILVGAGLLNEAGEHLLNSGITGPCYIISDSNVFPEHGRRLQKSLQLHGITADVFVVPSGESSKTLDVAQSLYDWLTDHKAERGHAILALGGGMIGDLAGFVAATFLRGIPIAHFPTSITAMVDASVGGKTAVNLPQAKNQIGSFHQPHIVISDTECLWTLPKRERAEGWAEAIKHSLILDEKLFPTFEYSADPLLSLDPDLTNYVIARSVAIKAKIIDADEKETTGLRTLLNYGHTIGHALESTTNYQLYLHGEAVSIGMVGAAYLSYRLGLIPWETVTRIQKVLHSFELPTHLKQVPPKTILQAMSLDKKLASGSIRWVVLETIGHATIRHDVPENLVNETLVWLNE